MQPLRYQPPVDYSALFGPGQTQPANANARRQYQRSPGLSALAQALMQTPAEKPLTPNQTAAFNSGAGPVNANYANLLAGQTYNAGTPSYFNSAIDLTADDKRSSSY